jgi:hypothetical protein
MYHLYIVKDNNLEHVDSFKFMDEEITEDFELDGREDDEWTVEVCANLIEEWAFEFVDSKKDDETFYQRYHFKDPAWAESCGYWYDRNKVFADVKEDISINEFFPGISNFDIYSNAFEFYLIDDEKVKVEEAKLLIRLK